MLLIFIVDRLIINLKNVNQKEVSSLLLLPIVIEILKRPFSCFLFADVFNFNLCWRGNVKHEKKPVSRELLRISRAILRFGFLKYVSWIIVWLRSNEIYIIQRSWSSLSALGFGEEAIRKVSRRSGKTSWRH